MLLPCLKLGVMLCSCRGLETALPGWRRPAAVQSSLQAVSSLSWPAAGPSGLLQVQMHPLQPGAQTAWRVNGVG